MIKNKDSLKAKANNLSKEINIPSQYIIQNYMFESMLKRISKSKYKDKFIIKGGLLLSSIFGVNLRSTMDMDTTIKGLPLNKNTITNIINEIISIDVGDNITMELNQVKDIRTEEIYSGYNVNIIANFEGLKTYLLIDITTGDIITYKEVNYKYKTLFDDNYIEIMTYNVETIIAEKYESIISRNIDNTRMKDYYDLYMFVNTKWNLVNKETLRNAIKNTSMSRNTEKYILESKKYIDMIKDNLEFKKLWKNYQSTSIYARDINFDETIKAIQKISELLIPVNI